MTPSSTSLPTRVEISWNDLHAPEVDAQVARMREAQAAPLVSAVGAPPPAASGARAWLRGNVASMALAGLTGGLVGWGLAEVIAQPESSQSWYGDGVTLGTMIFVTVFALCLGTIVSAWEGIGARSWPKAGAAIRRALPLLVGGGVVGGFLASKIYQSVMDAAIKRAMAQALAAGEVTPAALNTVKTAAHFGRGLGFAIVGAAIGVALGLASRSQRRAVNGAVGGAVGGFVGGFLFDYVGEWIDSGIPSRIVALCVTGILVGVAIGLVEAARKEHWLEIVSGGMAGKQFILYHPSTLVGSAPDCHVTLIKDPAISPHHAVLDRQQSAGLAVRAVDPGSPVLVNGRAVTSVVLGDADLVQLGATVLRFREKAPASPAPGPIYG